METRLLLAHQMPLCGGPSCVRVRGVVSREWTGPQPHSPPAEHSCVAHAAQLCVMLLSAKVVDT